MVAAAAFAVRTLKQQWLLFPFQHVDAAAGAGTDATARCQPHGTGSNWAQEKEESGLCRAGIGSRGTTEHGVRSGRHESLRESCLGCQWELLVFGGILNLALAVEVDHMG